MNKLTLPPSIFQPVAPLTPRPILGPGLHAPASMRTLRRRSLGLFLFLLALYGATASVNVGPRISDGRSVFAVTAALVDRHAVDVQPPELGVPGLDGRYYSKFGLGQSLVAVPLYLAGRAIGSVITPAPSQSNTREQAVNMTAAWLNPILVALLCALLPLLAVRLRIARPLPALWSGLLCGLVTPLWPYTQTFFGEPLIALCLVLALFWMWPVDPSAPSSRIMPLLGCGMALGLAVLTRLDSAIYVPFFVVAAALLPGASLLESSRIPSAGSSHTSLLSRILAATLVAVPVVIALAITAWYNNARFGAPLETGYGRGAQGESVDLIFHRTVGLVAEGLWDLLASPGKGLLFYAPLVILVPSGVWLLVHNNRRAPVVLLLVICGVDWLAHANLLIRWLGGWAWGPRFLIPVVPLLVLLAGSVLSPPRFVRSGRLAMATLALAGLLVQVPAVLADYHPYLDDLTVRYSHYAGDPSGPYRAEDAYIPNITLSPIVGQWRLVLDSATWRDQRDWGYRPVQDVAVGQHYAAPVPHTWWAALASEGVPIALWIWPLAALAIVGVGGGLLMLIVRDPPQ